MHTKHFPRLTEISDNSVWHLLSRCKGSAAQVDDLKQSVYKMLPEQMK